MCSKVKAPPKEHKAAISESPHARRGLLKQKRYAKIPIYAGKAAVYNAKGFLFCLQRKTDWGVVRFLFRKAAVCMVVRYVLCRVSK